MTTRLLVLFFFLASPLFACPFCNPGEADVFDEVAGAQAVVLVKKIETRKYKVLQSLRGPVKVGRVVVAAEPHGKLGKQGHWLLTTAGPPNLPYWSDAPRVLNERELAFAKKALKLGQAPQAEQWDFAAKHLQDKSSEISAAAYNLLAAAPLTEVQKRAKIVGQGKLLAWVKNKKIAPERQALYLLMICTKLGPEHSSWLQGELFHSKLAPSSPILGPLTIAYLHTTGVKGLSKVQSKFYDPKLPAARMTALNRALTLVREQTPSSSLKSAIQKLFHQELEHAQRGAFVLAPLAIWGDETPSAQVEELFRKNENITWVKVAVIRYFRSFQSAKSREALARLAQVDPKLVKRTTDAYRRADLGID